MKIDWLKSSDNWLAVKRACRNTINREGAGITPDSKWKRRLLLSEHSPIRKLKIEWRWSDLFYWVSVHFVRHWLGIVHFVGTQRTDRTGIERGTKPEDSPVVHECEANAQALINISRKRLCHQASSETREAWQAVKDQIAKVEPELASCMVKECVYRNGFCPEFKSCGYNKTYDFELERKQYLEGMEEQVNK